MDSRELLVGGAEQMGLRLSEAQTDQLLDYLTLILKWNKTYNLSAIRDVEEGVKKHLIDSLSIIEHLGDKSLLDVGAGAGLPGLVIGIMRPDLSVSVLDSVGKKCRFMQFAKTQLQLDNVSVINARVEDYRPAHCFGQITSRAFAQIDKTLALTKHLLCDNGSYLLMKGDHFELEVPAQLEVSVISTPVPYVSDKRVLLKIHP